MVPWCPLTLRTDAPSSATRARCTSRVATLSCARSRYIGFGQFAVPSLLRCALDSCLPTGIDKHSSCGAKSVWRVKWHFRWMRRRWVKQWFFRTCKLLRLMERPGIISSERPRKPTTPRREGRSYRRIVLVHAARVKPLLTKYFRSRDLELLLVNKIESWHT